MTRSGRKLARELYVGYMATPRPHRRFVQIVAPLLLIFMLGSAAAIATNRIAWGDGVWEIAAAKTYTGTVRLTPYPLLEVSTVNGESAPAGPYLLVMPGKFGSAERVGEFDGSAVTIEGFELRRDGRRIIEIDTTAPEPIVPRTGADAVPAAPIVWTGVEPTTLGGEILDSKCYIGAMKPGEGRGHKACAINCISGGIPPMVVERGADGTAQYFLLTDPEGNGLTDSDIGRLLPLIADPIRATGSVGVVGDWHILAIDPATGVTRR